MKETRIQRILKRGELAVRRTFISLLSKRSTQATTVRPLPLPPNPKILLLRQDRLGDAIITTPLLVALQEKYPDAQMMMLLGENNKGIAPLLPIKCETFIYKKKLFSDIGLLRSLRKMNIDVLIDLQDNASATSSILTAGIGATYSIGIEKENASSYNVLVKQLDKGTYHISRRIAELLRPLGIDPDSISLQPKLNLPKSEKITGRIGVNISVGKPSCWVPPIIQGEICSLIAEVEGVDEILVFAHPKSKSEQDEVIAIANNPKVKPAPVTHSYGEFASLLSTCEILLTPDTSVVHLGAALGIPMVAYYPFSPPTLHYWTPVGVPYEMIIHEPLREIDPHEVASSFKQLYHRVTENILEQEATV